MGCPIAYSGSYSHKAIPLPSSVLTSIPITCTIGSYSVLETQNMTDLKVVETQAKGWISTNKLPLSVGAGSTAAVWVLLHFLAKVL